MMNETTTGTQEMMSLAQAHEWKYLAEKAAKQRAGALARLKDMTAQKDIWKERAERAELARDEARNYMTKVVIERNAAADRAERAEAALAELRSRNPVNVGDTIRLYQDRTEKTLLVESVEYSLPLVTRIEGTSDDGPVIWKIRDSGTFTILKYAEG